MKIFVEHDAKGNIHSIGVTAGGSGGATVLQSGPGRHVSVVDAPEVKHAKDFDNLRNIKERYRLEGHPGQAKLVKK